MQHRDRSFDPDNFTLFDWIHESICLRRPCWRREWTTNWVAGVMVQLHYLWFGLIIAVVAILTLALLGQRARQVFVQVNTRMERTTDSRK